MAQPKTRCGLTLIEVIAGLSLLSLLLVGALMSFGRLQKQANLSARRIQACQVADQLLSQWMSNGANFPLGQTGSVGQDNLIWATRVVESQTIRSIRMHTVRLEITEPTILTKGEQVVLAMVDVLLADEVIAGPNRQGMSSVESS